jgi:hypothetical protein
MVFRSHGDKFLHPMSVAKRWKLALGSAGGDGRPGRRHGQSSAEAADIIFVSDKETATVAPVLAETLSAPK